MTTRRPQRRWIAPSMLAVAVACTDAGAAGFALFEQSARGLGSAFAGEAAAAEDPSTIYYNAAGLGWVSGTQLAVSGFAIMPSATFTNEGSHLNRALGGGPLGGNDGGDGAPLGLVPTIFASHQLGHGLAVGLGVNTPFGLTTDWDSGWVGRYGALTSDLRTININPTVAWRPLPWLAVGVGADIEYAKAKLTNALDLGGICEIFGGQAGLPPGACAAGGFAPQSLDGTVRVTGEDWAGGYNVGVMLQPWETTRIGLAYRSHLTHDLQGDADFFLPKQGDLLRTLSGALVNTGGRATLELPERASLAVVHQLTPSVAALFDVTWTRWSRFQSIVFEFDNPKQPTIVEPESWNDSFRYALGFRWDVTKTVQLRTGTAFDQTPVPSPRYRTARIPDSDRVWLAGGLAWAPTDRLRFTLGYAHLFAFDVPVRNPDPVTGNVLSGEFSASANIVGIQATWLAGWPPLGRWTD